MSTLSASTMTTSSLYDNTTTTMEQLPIRSLYDGDDLGDTQGTSESRSPHTEPELGRERDTDTLANEGRSSPLPDNGDVPGDHDEQQVAKKEATLRVVIDQTEPQDDVFYIDVSVSWSSLLWCSLNNYSVCLKFILHLPPATLVFVCHRSQLTFPITLLIPNAPSEFRIFLGVETHGQETITRR